VRAASAFAVLLLTLTLPACATQAAKTPQTYVVLKKDASIPFSGSTIRGFQVADDDSLILDAGSRWYRAILWSSCQRDLKFESAIGLASRPTDTFDRFSRVLVDGRSCPIQSLDEIENPRVTREKTAAPKAS
jgi:hypothetical protein